MNFLQTNNKGDKMKQSTIDLIAKHNKGSEYRIVLDIWDCEENRQRLKNYIKKNEAKKTLILKEILYDREQNRLIKLLPLTDNIGVHQAVKEYFEEYPAITKEEIEEATKLYHAKYPTTEK